MKITLHDAPMGYLLIAEDGRDRFLQFEHDLARAAEYFGFQPDSEARGVVYPRDFLDEHVGKSIEDLGDFD